eukprot:522789_1
MLSKQFTTNETKHDDGHRYIEVSLCNENEMEEEEEKYYIGSHEPLNISTRNLQKLIPNNTPMRHKTNFVEYHIEDYIQCSGDISECKAMQRIIHLLDYQRSTLPDCNQDKNPLYEYIVSFNHYSVAAFMEDWYHSKTVHFKTDIDYKWVADHKWINCNYHTDNQCEHITRYQRARGRELYAINIDIDLKNNILKDHITSIHSFIFHANSQQRNEKHKTIQDTEPIFANDSKTEKLSQEQIWSNNPVSIKECEVNQIIFILKIINFNEYDKLKVHKNEIIEYILQNSVDGDQLNKSRRKKFMNDVALYLGDNKCKIQLGKLYKCIMQYNISKFTTKEEIDSNNILSNNPATINECSVQQIIYILHADSFATLDKLKAYKQNIIEYFTAEELTGEKLHQMKRKPFIMEISAHLRNNKLKPQLGKLYAKITNFDLNKYTVQSDDVCDNIQQPNNKKEQIQPKLTSVNSGKFVTSMVENNEDEEASYYAFGQQYRYTDNFSEINHPLFVKSKYKDFKEELEMYFKALNEENDKRLWKRAQHEKIAKLNSPLHPFLNDLVYDEILNETSFDFFWQEQVKTNDSVIDLMKQEHSNCRIINAIIDIISKSTADSTPDKSVFFNDFVFIPTLNEHRLSINNKIKERLDIGEKKIKSFTQKQMSSVLNSMLLGFKQKKSQTIKTFKNVVICFSRKTWKHFKVSDLQNKPLLIVKYCIGGNIDENDIPNISDILSEKILHADNKSSNNIRQVIKENTNFNEYFNDYEVIINEVTERMTSFWESLTKEVNYFVKNRVNDVSEELIKVANISVDELEADELKWYFSSKKKDKKWKFKYLCALLLSLSPHHTLSPFFYTINCTKQKYFEKIKNRCEKYDLSDLSDLVQIWFDDGVVGNSSSPSISFKDIRQDMLKIFAIGY